MNKPILHIIPFFCLLLFALPAAALPYSADTLTIANVLQSHMVVQQGQPFRVWGNASPGTTLRISATWTNTPLKLKADASGRWIGEIPVPLASRGNFTAHRLSVVSGKDTAVLEDLLIGEVWICTGQSNMTFMLDSIPGWGPGVPGFREEVAAANYPYIRLIKIGTALEETPQDEAKGEWKPCTPKTVGGFSAVGYFFGKRLFDSLQVPIGLVSNGIPAAACQSFTDRSIMESDPALRKKYIEPFLNKPRDEKEHIITTLLRPSLIYNGMIYPLRHLSIRGFLWYQGEGNREDGELYTKLCSVMLRGWRKDFQQGDLPFYFVQMPPYIIRGEDSLSTSYARFREHQAAMLSIHNTGMVVIMDVGDPYDIHPRNKKPVGERLAALALHDTYHYRRMAYRGPEFFSFRTEGGTVKIAFEPATTAGGLRTIDGRPPEHFYVAGADHIFHQAAAKIVDREIWLQTDEVTSPVAIRYAFTNAPMTNLSNAAGLPAAPFRTDKWDK